MVGQGGDFVDDNDLVCVQDPTAHSNGPNACLVRLDILQEALDRNDLSLCWTLIGEKRYLNSKGRGVNGNETMDPLLTLRGGQPEGLTQYFTEHLRDDGTILADLIAITHTPA